MDTHLRKCILTRLHNCVIALKYPHADNTGVLSKGRLGAPVHNTQTPMERRTRSCGEVHGLVSWVGQERLVDINVSGLRDVSNRKAPGGGPVQWRFRVARGAHQAAFALSINSIMSDH